MKSISINLITARTVFYVLPRHLAHKTVIVVSFLLYFVVILQLAGGFTPFLSHVTRGALSTLSAPLR